MRRLGRSRKLILWFSVEPANLASALPKLNVVAVNKLLGVFRSFGIIGALQFNDVDEVAVRTDGINAIVRHNLLTLDQARAFQLTVAGCCRGADDDAPSLRVRPTLVGPIADFSDAFRPVEEQVDLSSIDQWVAAFTNGASACPSFLPLTGCAFSGPQGWAKSNAARPLIWKKLKVWPRQ